MATTTKVRSAQDSKFENIVVGKFSANEDFDQHVSGVVLASQRTKGTFSVNHFAIAQFLASAATVSAETSGKLMAKLGLLLFQDEKDMEITLTRAEVIELRDVLQVRMAHCEHERDARSDKFNPDTYIGQKFLLLDIREWLMITAVGDFKEQEEPKEETISTGPVPVYTLPRILRTVEYEMLNGKLIYEEDKECTQWWSVGHSDILRRFRSVKTDLMHNTYGDQTEVHATLTLSNLHKECDERGLKYQDLKEAIGIHEAI